LRDLHASGKLLAFSPGAENLVAKVLAWGERCVNDREYFLSCAERERKAAAACKDPQQAKKHLELARGFEILAEQAAAREGREGD
jgi:hypothetical protein